MNGVWQVFFLESSLVISTAACLAQLEGNNTTVGKTWFSIPVWTHTVNHLLSFHLCVPSLVMEVARRLVWRCLVDDPVLFFRTILEQFTKKDKQVSWKKIVLL